MITSLDEALEQNKKLVDEAFRVTELYGQTLKINAELNEELQSLREMDIGRNPFANSKTDSDLMKKLISTEAALKNLENVNMMLFKELKDTRKSLEDSERKAEEAKLKLTVTQDELAAIQKRGGTQKGNSDEFEAALKEKELQLAMATSEITEKDKLLTEASEAVVNLRREQLSIFDLSQKLSEQLSNSQKMTENNLKMELQEAKFENHRLAEMIFRDEQMRAQQDAQINALKAQLQAYAGMHQQQHPMQMAQQSHQMSSMAMNYEISQMKNQMQMEIERLKQQQNLQKN